MRPLPSGFAPVASTPMKFPATMLFELKSLIPSETLPEITFRSASSAIPLPSVPMRLNCAWVSTCTPWETARFPALPLPIASNPVWSVPM